MTSEQDRPAPSGARPETRRSLAVCALIGAAVMAAVDEIVFHQVLHWHHFYDRSTPGVALLSDGLLHTAELLGLVAGFFLLADLRRRRALSAAHARAGFFLGAGLFQLFDGVVDHKLLRLHQVRYGVDVTPYDWAWNLAALALLAVGAVLAVRARRRTRLPAAAR
ncbi:hypothetical protein GCM10010358_43800 [Streptomyces minutiscleroticus]|uniref:DUF2243 domain-containing protein n=1 Tax=Streptomyces minutiscleroticus TaxID=68238 RepID=A0A918NP53_9ACTN|nr:DUF2243 domain-containing protein [Streptomyces minutiscleroticus]GGX84953.1 hypothetical protein GCM10010358_43800 [Streptomyces minutiscleroticus]